jgi:hypothetical protein
MCVQSQILFSSAGEDEPPMTMQVAMIARDGIVLASDLKWVTTGNDPRGPFRHPEYKSKIKVDREIAVCCAGEDMISSTRVADEILLHWREGDGDEVQRIRGIVTPLFKRRHIECLVAIAPPSNKLIYIRGAKIAVGIGSKTEWRLTIAPVRGPQTAGDVANDATFWLRYYDASLAVEELKGLAAHLVVEAQNFNNAMIGGLEVVISDGSAFSRLREDECQRLEADARKQASEIGGLILRPPDDGQDGSHSRTVRDKCP